MKRICSLVLLIVFFAACQNREKNPVPKVIDSIETSHDQRPAESGNAQFSRRDSVSATGEQVLRLLKDKNYTELIKYFSADGVLFSPYGYIEKSKSKILTADDFLEAISKKWILTWGTADGTGDPIKLTVAAYLDKYVYNADFLEAEAVGYNEIIKQGSSPSNLSQIYPGHHFIEYHFSGFDQKMQGMDWCSLRLVFQRENGEYYIVAIIHDQWTI